MTANLDPTRLIDPMRTKHAHHTGWAWSPDDNCYVLTLHDEDDNLFCVASYTFERWMDVFNSLKEAQELVLKTKGGRA
jgi:hypothetical protein